MKSGRTWLCIAAVLAMASAGGCGTIVFFPHKSAEKAADKILDDILIPANGSGKTGVGEIARAPDSIPVRQEKHTDKAE